MTVRLSVKQAVWRAHVADVVTRTDGLVPVVKGNGYGFGRLRLAAIAAEFCDTVAVGTVHELGGLPSELVHRADGDRVAELRGDRREPQPPDP